MGKKNRRNRQRTSSGAFKEKIKGHKGPEETAQDGTSCIITSQEAKILADDLFMDCLGVQIPYFIDEVYDKMTWVNRTQDFGAVFMVELLDFWTNESHRRERKDKLSSIIHLFNGDARFCRKMMENLTSRTIDYLDLNEHAFDIEISTLCALGFIFTFSILLHLMNVSGLSSGSSAQTNDVGLLLTEIKSNFTLEDPIELLCSKK